jgi:hypothetical protein
MDSLTKGVGRSRDAKTVQDRFVSISEDASLGVNENVAHVTGFSAAVAVTLPQVADAAGRVYAVKILDAADINNITLQDNDESRSWSDLTCSNASGGKAVLFSDGEEWHLLAATNVS